MKNRYVVRQIFEGNSVYRRCMYGVFYEVEDTGIHTNDEYGNLVVLCHNELIAQKIRELLECDDFIERENR